LVRTMTNIIKRGIPTEWVNGPYEKKKATKTIASMGMVAFKVTGNLNSTERNW